MEKKEKITSLSGKEVEITILPIGGRKVNQIISKCISLNKMTDINEVLEDTGEIDSNNQKIYKVVRPKSQEIDLRGSNFFGMKDDFMAVGIKGINIDEICADDYNRIYSENFEKYVQVALKGVSGSK